MKITPPGLNRQFQETGSMFLRNIFSGVIFLVHDFQGKISAN